MAVFGVPTVHEDDAVRAVRAACRMVERLERWNEERGPEDALELRIGLSTGEVVASSAAGADLRHAATRSPSPHGSSRPPSPARSWSPSAPPGPCARRRSKLRALEGPVSAWLVEGAREEPEPPAIAAPLVGRDHELASLRTTLDRVRRERRPALVTVVGDAGVGKSRLARELLAPLEGQATVLVGRCLPGAQGSTLEALAEMLKAEAGVLDTDPADEAFAKVERLVEATIDPDLAVDPSRTVPALASTLGLRPGGDSLAGSTHASSTALTSRRGWRCSPPWGGARRSSRSSRTCTGPTRPCSTCSTSSPSGWTGRSSSCAPRARTCAARGRTGAGAAEASARCRSTR